MRACRLALGVCLAMMVPVSISQVASNPIQVNLADTMDLSQLVGTNGYNISGGGEAGGSVAVGDVNGDGMGDVIVGAWNADTAYVVFGGLNMDPSLDLASLDGLNGFSLTANASLKTAGKAALGFAVASADVNGDGISDIIAGAAQMGPVVSGGACVVFGRAQFPATMDLSTDTLDGTNGFIIRGRKNSDWTGWSVGAGDLNGDGYSEIILGAPYGDPVVSGDKWRKEAGQVVVIYGKAGGFPPVIEISELGDQGFTVNGDRGMQKNGNGENDMAGWAVGRSVGDVNNDGLQDFIVGAWSADPTQADSLGKNFSINDVGEAYVVFGSRSFPEFLEVSSLDGTNGFALQTALAGEHTGMSVDISRDLNGDGISDIIVGATMASPDTGPYAGKVYVVFGKATPFAAELDLASLNGTNGFVINGETMWARAGMSVSAAGDVNMDGIADIIVSSDGTSDSSLRAAAYVIYGRAGGSFPALIDLSQSLDREHVGISVHGMDVAGYQGYKIPREPWGGVALHKSIAVAGGDVNGDCIGDVVVGTPWAGGYGGGAYVAFGRLPWRCEANFWLNGTCTPGGDLTCVACRTGGCAEGTFLGGGPCTGWEGRDSMVCQGCKTQCPAGRYLVGNCPGGAAPTDTRECLPCRETCEAGQYMDADCSTGLLTADPGCRTCRTCGSGTYASNTCDGTLAEDVTCTPCRTSCDAGFFMIGLCTGEELQDIQCEACTSTCAEGSYRTGACSGAGTSDAVQCTPCKTSCQPGQYLAGECGAWNESVSTQDFTCEQCSTCGFGEYLAEGCSGETRHDAAQCMPCNHTCPSGHFLAQSCDGSGTSDTARCEIIPPTPAPTPTPPPAPTPPTPAPTPAPTPEPVINVGVPPTPERTSATPAPTPPPTPAPTPAPTQQQQQQAVNGTVQVMMGVRTEGNKATFESRLAQFGSAIQAATPAATGVEITSVVDVAARRRMILQSQVEVDFKVHYADLDSADQGLSSELTEESLNVRLAEQGLPACTVVRSAELVQSSPPAQEEAAPPSEEVPVSVDVTIPIAVGVGVVALALMGFLAYKCKPRLFQGKKKELPAIVEFTSPFERTKSAGVTAVKNAWEQPLEQQLPKDALHISTAPPKAVPALVPTTNSTPLEGTAITVPVGNPSPVRNPVRSKPVTRPQKPSEAPAGSTAGWFSGHNEKKIEKRSEIYVSSSDAAI